MKEKLRYLTGSLSFIQGLRNTDRNKESKNKVLQYEEQICLSSQRQAIYLNKNLHRSLFIPIGAYFMSPRISWLLKAAKKKASPDLRMARLQKRIESRWSSESTETVPAPRPGTQQYHFRVSSHHRGLCAHRKTCTRMFETALSKCPSKINQTSEDTVSPSNSIQQ